MHYHLTDIQADFEINRQDRYQITAKKIISTDDRRTDRQTDGRHNGQTSRTTIVIFFRKKKKNNKNGL